MKAKNPNRGKFWRSVGVALAFLMAFIVIQFWVSLVFAIVDLAALIGENGMALFSDMDRYMTLYMGKTMQHMTVVVLLSNALTVGGFWLFYAARRKNFLKAVWVRKISWQTALLSLAYGFCMCFVMDLITSLLPIPDSVMADFNMQHNMLFAGNPWINFLAVVILAPLAEEVTFRGLCYTNLRKGMKPIFAGLISAGLFGLVHGQPIWAMVGFTAGMALWWIFERTGSIFCSILVHMTNNLLAFITEMVPVSDVVGYILIGIALVGFPVTVYFLMRFNPKEKEIPDVDILAPRYPAVIEAQQPAGLLTEEPEKAESQETAAEPQEAEPMFQAEQEAASDPEEKVWRI